MYGRNAVHRDGQIRRKSTGGGVACYKGELWYVYAPIVPILESLTDASTASIWLDFPNNVGRNAPKISRTMNISRDQGVGPIGKTIGALTQKRREGRY